MTVNTKRHMHIQLQFTTPNVQNEIWIEKVKEPNTAKQKLIFHRTIMCLFELKHQSTLIQSAQIVNR